MVNDCRQVYIRMILNPDLLYTPRYRGYLAAVDAVEPGNAEDAGGDADDYGVAFVEAVKVVGVDSEALEFLPRAQGCADDQPAAAAHHATHVEAALHDGGVVDDVLGRIELAVEKEGGGENPGQRDKTGVNALEDFHVAAVARAAIEKNRDGQADEENDAEKNQHPIEIERRVKLADVGKQQRAEQKHGGALDEARTKFQLGDAGGQATRRTPVHVALGAAVKTPGHSTPELNTQQSRYWDHSDWMPFPARND